MGRTKIDLPSDFSFHTPLEVRITDLNYGGHVGNDTFLSYLQEARLRFLAQWHWSELQFAGVSLIMASAALEYKGEVFYGDRLQCEVGAGDAGRAGFELYYRITKNDGEKTVLHAATGMVCFDYDKRKVVPLPEAAKVLFSAAS